LECFLSVKEATTDPSKYSIIIALSIKHFTLLLNFQEPHNKHELQCLTECLFLRKTTTTTTTTTTNNNNNNNNAFAMINIAVKQ
jgi:hypothetical protein